MIVGMGAAERRVIKLPGVINLRGKASKTKAKPKKKTTKPVSTALVQASPKPKKPKVPQWVWVAGALAVVGGALYYARGRGGRRRPFVVG